ncbi:MAG: UvrD-helicase domain-containing protein [Candidatus Berkelbacteria bacterium]|nr:UvrD-helicase domain-containing protein [Candidatus Berkelbacteria bacterium]
MDILKDLNDRQKKAVIQTEGPVLILAGAGSGKTRALTHRIAYLIKEKHIRADNILAVTFTNKAAGVMKERVAALLGARDWRLKAALPWLGTFHSICVRILRREGKALGISNKFIIYDEDDSMRAIKRAMRELEIAEKKHNPRAIKAYISGAKGELIKAEAYSGYANDYFQKIVARVYLKYEKMLEGSDALDFDDLILKTVELFQKFPEILDKYQDRFRYILVDEYQDTNHAQYIFLKLLSQKYRNVFVIGDDWQSIYSFRGAKFQNILDFKKDYPEAKVILLEENYRSTAPILGAAQEVIRQNEMRSDKNLFTKKGGGAPVVLVVSRDKFLEISFILDEILSLTVGESKKLSDFVILFRTNAQTRTFEEKLIERRLPYRIVGGVRFYERREVKDILAYLKLIQNEKDIVSLSRVINTPPRGIGAKTLEKIISLGDEAGEQVPKFSEFNNLIQDLRKDSERLPLPDLIDKIMTKTRYREYLSDGTVESQGRLENIEELKAAASSHADLAAFLESVSLVADIDLYNEKEEALTLMTVHSAKGLEFPVVFISGLEEGLFPHSQSLDNQFDLEEERRLFYVGMTRAMERLYLSYSKAKFTYGSFQVCLPSRFLDELSQDKMDLVEI